MGTSSGETLDRGVKRLFNISKLWNSVLLFCHWMMRIVSRTRAATIQEFLHIHLQPEEPAGRRNQPYPVTWTKGDAGFNNLYRIIYNN